MLHVPEQFISANKSAVNTLLHGANTAFASTERFTSLSVGAIRTVLDEGATNTKALLATRTPKEAVVLQTSLLQSCVERTINYSRSVCEIAAETQQQFAKLAHDQFGDFQKQVISLVNEVAKRTPGSSEAAVSAVKNSFAPANTAFASLGKAVKQITEITEQNIEVARTASVAALEKTVAVIN